MPKGQIERAISQLMEDIRLEAGSSGRRRILELLRDLPVYDFADARLNPREPLPMFFDEGWKETFDALIKEADRDQN